MPRRTFTGAWIETKSPFACCAAKPVAPSRVRGLKRTKARRLPADLRVAPSRVRGLKQRPVQQRTSRSPVAPSRVRGLKQRICSMNP